MNSFWTLRWRAYKNARTDSDARRVLFWDVGRVVTLAVCFGVGCVLHPAFVDRLLANSSPRFIAGITTFGTFLASFVLSVMTATGKREMGLMPDARSVRMMEQRLRWLLSDQLIMVVSALAAAVCGLIWMAVETLCVAPPLLLTAAVVAFGGLAGFNALRLPFQIWELQFSALMEDRKRAHERLNKQNDEHFKD